MTREQIGKVLLRAADIIEKRGWCQGRYSDYDGRFCAVGAILNVTESCVLQQASRRFLAEHLPNQNVTAWNDVKNRRKKHIIDKMRAVAKLAIAKPKPKRPKKAWYEK